MWCFLCKVPHDVSPNTLLYLSLNGTALDEVSQTNATRYGGALYETLSSGLQVAHTTNTKYIITPSITMNGAITISGWLYRYNGDVFFRADKSSNPRSFYQIQITTGNQGGGGFWNNGTWYGSAGGTSSNGWFYVVVTCGSNGVKLYVNGELIYSNSFTNFSWRTQAWGINFDQSSNSQVNANGMFSNLIIEKVVWSLDEVRSYFNKTKHLYGL